MDSVNQGVIDKLKSRAERGHLKYGVTMDRTDLSMMEWLQHAQDELLDGAVYLEKLIRVNGVCKWGRTNSACGEPVDGFYGVEGFEFCPFCGRKIEEDK